MKKIYSSCIAALVLLGILISAPATAVKAEDFNDSTGKDSQFAEELIVPDDLVELSNLTDAEIENWEIGETKIQVDDNMLRSASGWTTSTLNSSVKIKSQAFINYHPQFPNRLKRWGYFFSATNKVNATVSASLNLGYVSFSIAADGGTSGTVLKAASQNRYSRPAIKGDVYKLSYTVRKYSGSGVLISTTKKTGYSVRNTDVYIINY